jgi:hypothetical protein
MNKYFIQLFLQEKTVILPGFGALILLSDNFREITFLHDLKTNDGRLANFISETESVDEQVAQNMIAKFIREIESNINKGESFDIFEFGSFKKNDLGEIEFESWLENVAPLPKPLINEDESNEDDCIVEETTQITNDPISEQDESIIPKPKGKAHKTTEHLDSVALIQALLNGDFSENEEEVNEDKDLIEKTAFVPKVSTNHFSENKLIIEDKDLKKKKRKFPFWLVFLLFTLSTFSLILWFNDKTVEQLNPLTPNKNIDKELVAKNDSISSPQDDSSSKKNKQIFKYSNNPIVPGVEKVKKDKKVIKKKTPSVT